MRLAGKLYAAFMSGLVLVLGGFAFLARQCPGSRLYPNCRPLSSLRHPAVRPFTRRPRARLGAAAIFDKPFDLDDLLEKVRETVRSREAPTAARKQ